MKGGDEMKQFSQFNQMRLKCLYVVTGLRGWSEREILRKANIGHSAFQHAKAGRVPEDRLNVMLTTIYNEVLSPISGAEAVILAEHYDALMKKLH